MSNVQTPMLHENESENSLFFKPFCFLRHKNRKKDAAALRIRTATVIAFTIWRSKRSLRQLVKQGFHLFWVV